MKYTRLTKEQFEALQEEFTRFLATQSITADEWQEIKRNKPEVAEAELDVFSDLVWEGALSAAKYLENASPDQLFCFAVQNELIELIHVKVSPNTAPFFLKDSKRGTARVGLPTPRNSPGKYGWYICWYSSMDFATA